MSGNLTLVSHVLCPYVQRAAIALAEKGVAFERVHVDLDDPPAWFHSLSPLGRVPLLQVDGHVLFESAVILEYLEDTTAPALHPAEPLERARHRAWIEFGSSLLEGIWRFYTAREEDDFRSAIESLADRFRRLEQELGAGPWFGGERFSLVDCVYGPIFRYFDVFDDIDDFGILSGLDRVNAWRERLAARDTVAGAVRDDYKEELRRFLLQHASCLSSRMEPAPATA